PVGGIARGIEDQVTSVRGGGRPCHVEAKTCARSGSRGIEMFCEMRLRGVAARRGVSIVPESFHDVVSSKRSGRLAIVANQARSELKAPSGSFRMTYRNLDGLFYSGNITGRSNYDAPARIGVSRGERAMAGCTTQAAIDRGAG